MTRQHGTVSRQGRLWALFSILLVGAGASGGLQFAEGAVPEARFVVTPSATSMAATTAADTTTADTTTAMDTLRTRADTVRARVLGRIQAAPAPGGRLPWLVSDADSLEDREATAATRADRPEPDPDSRAAPFMAPTRTGAEPPARTALPAGADSIMEALARLPGYRVASFEGVRMEFSEETRVLLLLGEPAPEPVPAPEPAAGLALVPGDSVPTVDPPLIRLPDSVLVTDTAVVIQDSLVVRDPTAEAAEAAEAGARGDERAAAATGRPARFSGDGVRLEADSSIVYDDATGIVRTRGSTLFTPDRGDPVRSRSLVYDVRAARGTALGAQTRYSEGMGQWFVEADMDSVEDGLIYGSRARFTSDDRPQPNSHFEASELKVVANDILVARSVRLHFQEVPVLWLPFIAQPLQSGRSSGLLTPQFSVNDIVRTSGAYQRRLSNVGMYWAISDYADATLAGDWWSGQYTAMTGSLRYRWARQFLGGEFAGRHFWRETGQRDLAISTRNNWEPTERARASMSANYVSNTGLVRQNSLDPRELTASINSQGGIQQRFDWGSASVEARRQQYMTDDRVEMTLPSATLSVSTFTLFPAGSSNPRWYNNVTVGASSSFGRDVRQPGTPRVGEPFRFTQLDQVRTQGSLRSNVNLANLSMSGNANYRQNAFSGVPDIFARPPEFLEGLLPPGLDGEVPLDPLTRPRLDYADAEVSWSASLSYQQRIIGTTSISPSLTLSGQFLRSDSIAAAQSFVESPARIAFGVSTQAELYGFFPGFGEFDAVRHKVTPSVSFSYAPEVDPTELQVQVFGARALGPQKVMTLGFNQTFEARRSQPARGEAPSAAGRPGEPGLPGGLPARDQDPDAAADPDAVRVAEPESEPGAQAQAQDLDPVLDDQEPETRDPSGVQPDTEDRPTSPGSPERRASPLDTAAEGFSRPPASQVITLLGLSTSAVTYDLVRADSTGFWLDGFTTTELRNTVRSDYLRGLNLSFSHLLFDDPRGGVGGVGAGEGDGGRRFSPHLAQVSLGFSLNNNSAVVQSIGRLLGISSGESRDARPAPRGFDDPTQRGGEMDEGYDDAFASDGFDADRVLPGLSGRSGRRGAGMGMAQGGWSANLNYSLRRPRESIGGVRAQMLNGTISFRPTELLSVNWATAYDFEAASFTDHTIRVTRDMYDWEASFGFRQAVNGNWTFQFEVSLKANRDLRFDYEQRNLDGGSSAGGFPGQGGLPGGFF